MPFPLACRLCSPICFAAGLPLSILRVTDDQQSLLDDNGVTSSRVIDPGLAELATSCLQGVIADGVVLSDIRPLVG